MGDMLIWVGGAALLAALFYWLIVVGEGTYLGPWAVRLIYHFGAPYYDEVRAFPAPDDTATLAPLLLGALAGRRRPRVLDVATGTGRVPLLLAAQPAFDGEIDALDLTPAMLERARARQRALCPAAPIAWRQGEAGDLPWDDGSFDLVTCLEALEFFPRPRRALAEMARVLRPGGALVVSKYPDVWARALPLRGLTRAAMARALGGLGLAEVVFRPWQPGHYELVLARKLEESPAL